MRRAHGRAAARGAERDPAGPVPPDASARGGRARRSIASSFACAVFDIGSIEHPSQLGDFFTTGEDLRTHGAEAFLTGRPDTAFETTGTTSPVPKRVFFSNRELNAMGSASAAALHLLGCVPTISC